MSRDRPDGTTEALPSLAIEITSWRGSPRKSRVCGAERRHSAGSGM